MSDQVKGIALTLLGGICWGVSGSIGQYLFDVEGMDSRWLVPIRLGLAVHAVGWTRVRACVRDDGTHLHLGEDGKRGECEMNTRCSE